MKTSWTCVNGAIYAAVAFCVVGLSVCGDGSHLIIPKSLQHAGAVDVAAGEPDTSGLVRALCRSVSGSFSHGCECSAATDPHATQVLRKSRARRPGDEAVFSSPADEVRPNGVDVASSDAFVASVALKLFCSCYGDQHLELGGISGLPLSVQEIVVSDCRGGTVSLSSAQSSIGDSNLKMLKIINVRNLTLERGALDLNLLDGGVNDTFRMHVENVGTMNVERGAIRLSGKRSSIEWKNVVLAGLPSFSITAANLGLLELNGVLVSGSIETAAINLESSGTSLVFEKVDARSPVNPRWISGDASEFKLTECRLNLAPGAFQQISFSTSNPSIVIRNNVFGDSRWPSQIFPSLASRVFDFSFVDGSAIFNFTKNKAQCSAGNLEFLIENKKSSILHWLRCGLLKTLMCLESHLSPIFHSCQFDTMHLSNVHSTEKSFPALPMIEENSIFSGISEYEYVEASKVNDMAVGTSRSVELLSDPAITSAVAHEPNQFTRKTSAEFPPLLPHGVTNAEKPRYERGVEDILERRPYHSVGKRDVTTIKPTGGTGLGNQSANATVEQKGKSNAMQASQVCIVMFTMCIFVTSLALSRKSC